MTNPARPRRSAGACTTALPALAVAVLAVGCTDDARRDTPIDAFPSGSPTTVPGTAFEVPDVTIAVPDAASATAVPVERQVSQRDRAVARLLLQEQLLRVRLGASSTELGVFTTTPPTTDLPDGLVLERWIGGQDGYLVCLYDNETGLWALGSGYVFEGQSFADVRLGDGFDRRCL